MEAEIEIQNVEEETDSVDDEEMGPVDDLDEDDQPGVDSTPLNRSMQNQSKTAMDRESAYGHLTHQSQVSGLDHLDSHSQAKMSQGHRSGQKSMASASSSRQSAAVIHDY